MSSTALCNQKQIYWVGITLNSQNPLLSEIFKSTILNLVAVKFNTDHLRVLLGIDLRHTFTRLNLVVGHIDEESSERLDGAVKFLVLIDGLLQQSCPLE